MQKKKTTLTKKKEKKWRTKSVLHYACLWITDEFLISFKARVVTIKCMLRHTHTHTDLKTYLLFKNFYKLYPSESEVDCTINGGIPCIFFANSGSTKCQMNISRTSPSLIIKLDSFQDHSESIPLSFLTVCSHWQLLKGCHDNPCQWLTKHLDESGPHGGQVSDTLALHCK